MKFYGLPLDPPDDRHRWFFGPEEALNFIIYRANKANFIETNSFLQNFVIPYM